MKTKSIGVIILVGVIIGFSGCSNSEVSCGGKTELSLIETITLPSIKDKFIADTMNEKNSFSGTMYLTAKKLAESMDTGRNPSDMEGFKEANATMEKEFKSYKFSLHDIRTTNKDKELNKVECVGKITVELGSYLMNYDNVVYKAQLGDDKENVYVEVESME
jgi:hypothetical protein